MDIALGNRSQTTGRFNFVRDPDGDVSFDDTEAHAVVTSILEDKESYPFDLTHGSEIHTLRNLTRLTPSEAEAMALEALEPLSRPGVIVDQVAKASGRLTTAGVGRLDLDVRWTTPGGIPGVAKVGV